MTKFDNDQERLYTGKVTVCDLLEKDTYIIPLYQRNFAWEYNEVWQLLFDIQDNVNSEYHIGTLVVSEGTEHGKPIYEVIDGQQRLTALNIIYSVLTQKVGRKFSLNLKFESREKSNTALRVLRSNGTLEESYDKSLHNIQLAIKTTNEFIDKILKNDTQKYLEKFLNVCIFRVKLHQLTDKNHYFEVMNNRGEQLESHEILKSQFMDKLVTNEERETFSIIWDCCSDMNRRLEKCDPLKFLWGKDYKEKPWEKCDDFDFLKQSLTVSSKDKPETKEKYSIKSILSYSPREPKGKDEYVDEEYNSVIDFPNFLLQVLRIQGKENVKLDASKYLLEEFGCVSTEGNELPDPKKFILNLLRLRTLFDRYIIKRRKTAKTNRGWRWVIEQPEKENDKLLFVNTFGGMDSDMDDDKYDDALLDKESTSKHLCMIQSMFFVTFRRDVYMHWLTTALISVDADRTGNSLLYDLEKFSIDYIWDSRDSDGVERNEYAKGTRTHRYVFNFLDYQLWKLYYANRRDAKYEDYPEIGQMIEKTKKSFQYFVFTRRNSVEHYLSQEKALSFGIDKNTVNNFGNLSLINSSENSRLSNRDCKEKKDYHDRDKVLCQPSSLKYELMFTEDAVSWDKESIERQGDLFFKLLDDKSKKEGISYFQPNIMFEDTLK